jgi:hypothetical protein
MTDSRFVHAVSGRRTSTLPPLVVPGLWRLGAVEGCFLNRVSAEEGDALVADGTGRWALVAPGQRHMGQFWEELVPDTIEAENLRVLGERLDELEANAAAPEQWLSVPPLVPGIHEKVKLQAWEEKLPSALEHLRIVCYRPRMHLQTEVERVPITRARRLPGQAFAHLSAHPEDWERRTLTGVRPRRILTVHTGESLDIYENRLAVRLIDRLLNHLENRIRELRSVVDLLAYSLDFSKSASGTQWRRDRMYHRWGHMTVDEKDWEAGRWTLSFLEARVRELRVLLDSPLYRGISRGSFVSGALKKTNLLNKDQHYRHVAALWLVLGRVEQEQPPTPEVAYRSAQQQIRHFERFCLLVVVHGLAACGFRLRCDADGWRAEGQWGTYAVQRCAFGVVELEAEGPRTVIRLVPVHAGLTGAGDEGLKRVRESLDEARNVGAEGRRNRGRRGGERLDDTTVIVLYVGRASDLSVLSQDSADAVYSFGASQPMGRVGFLPVATQDIDSVERIARAIRWVTMGAVLAAYPPRISLPSTLALEDSPSGITVKAREIHVCKPVTEDENGIVNAAIENAMGAAAAQGRRGRAEATALEGFRGTWMAASEDVQRLAQCPMCRATGRSVDFKARDDGQFASLCRECDTRWGSSRCSKCRSGLPYLLPARMQTGSVERNGPTWVDAVYGADLLAIPAAMDGRSGKLVCPSCRAA